MTEKTVTTAEPIVLDVGRQKRKAIKNLKAGVGPLADRVKEVAQTAAEQLGTTDKEVVPVVIVYKKRTNASRGLCGELVRGL